MLGRRSTRAVICNPHGETIWWGAGVHTVSNGPPKIMYPLKCWDHRLLFSYIEYIAALQGQTRAAMAVAPPWGMMLLRPGPPGPIPTF